MYMTRNGFFLNHKICCAVIFADYYMASLTLCEIAACDWLRSTYAGPLFVDRSLTEKFKIAAYKSYTFDEIKQV